ncbi:MAG: PorP/SprF family type IX secretion system membrane protein [Bacteroidia bacterium]|jgi:type IX secretion system PorP/SprF family membrane protein
MKKIVAIIIILCLNALFLQREGGAVLAQDIHFSQFYMAPLTLNPGYAGALYGMEANANYKEQWRSVGSPYKTIAASYSLSLQKKKRAKGYFALGVNFFSDKAGDSKMGTSQANVTAAGHVYINRYMKFGGGLQIGFAQRSIDYTPLTWGNQFDGMAYNPNLSSRENLPEASSTMYPDVSAGIVYSYNNTAGMRRVTDNNDFRVNLGLAVFHASRPSYSFIGTEEKLFAKFVLHGNSLLSIPYSNIGFVPGFAVYNQGPAVEVFAGTMVRYVFAQKSKYTGNRTTNALSLGGYLRAKDAAVIAFMLEYSKYSIGMSYDVNVSRLKVASVGRGGFELSLRFNAANPFMVNSRSRF